MMKRIIVMAALLLGCGVSVCQNGVAKTGEGTQQVCQLISANPPGFHPFGFVPAEVKDKKLTNRLPRISFVVGEDGKVSNVKVVNGTGSPTVDAGVVKSVEAWKYKPQSGCVINMLMAINIDIR